MNTYEGSLRDAIVHANGAEGILMSRPRGERGVVIDQEEKASAQAQVAQAYALIAIAEAIQHLVDKP